MMYLGRPKDVRLSPTICLVTSQVAFRYAGPGSYILGTPAFSIRGSGS